MKTLTTGLLMTVISRPAEFVSRNRYHKPQCLQTARLQCRIFQALAEARLPTSSCNNVKCGGFKLVVKPPIQGTLFTLQRGAVPIICPSSYCRCKCLTTLPTFSHLVWLDCKTRYYSNYFITSASDNDAQRRYYGDIPRYIEVTDHYFVDHQLCKWITNEFVFPQYITESQCRM